MATEKEPQKEAQISLTASDLKDLITEAIKAGKAPNIIEQQQLDAQQKELQQAQEFRLRTAGEVRGEIEAKKWTHQTCSHHHANGFSHCVYIMEKGGTGYILCQKNQCIIRPDPRPAKSQPADVYDTNLFNREFQLLQNSQGDIIG